MATVSVYDSATNLTKTVTIDVGQATIKDDGGSLAFYVTVSTSAKDYYGNTIAPIVITTFSDDLTTEIKAAIISLFEIITGADAGSTSSETSVSPVLSSLSSLSSSSLSTLTSISSKSGI